MSSTGANNFDGLPEDFSLPLEAIAGRDVRGDLDILFGRAGRSNSHIGNIRFYEVLERKQWEYMRLQGRNKKKAFAMNIVLQLRQDGMRFWSWRVAFSRILEMTK